MSNRAVAFLAVLVGLVAALFWSNLAQPPAFPLQSSSPTVVRARQLPAPPAIPSTTEPVVEPAVPVPAQGNSESIGQNILRDYADPRHPAEHDLALMAELLENFTLLVKSASDHPLSANEDWSRALLGMNPARERFLPNDHRALNAKRQLVDRWGTPLFFHAVGKGQYAIRSAGPDGKLWTSDDIQRNPDSSFSYGANLPTTATR